MVYPLTVPAAGWQNPGIPGNYTKSYWQGATIFDPDSAIVGGSAVNKAFNCGVLSFWVNSEGFRSPALSWAVIAQAGTKDYTGQVPFAGAGVPPTFLMGSVGLIFNFQGPNLAMGGVGLFLTNYITNNQITIAGVPVGTGRLGSVTAPVGWHHHIVSFDTSQSCPNPLDPVLSTACRIQWAIDGGGGGIIWGDDDVAGANGGIFDTLQGYGDNLVTATTSVFPTQPFPSVSNNSFTTGNVGVSVTDFWNIASPLDCSVEFAYCYFGTTAGDTFFDLTYPGNLNQFLTNSLTPVNLGYGARNPTDQQTGSTLTPIFMHTGSATNPTSSVVPLVWKSLRDYKATGDLSLTSWVEYPDGSDNFYYAIEDSGPSFGGPQQPDISPTFWGKGSLPFGLEFQYNGASGLLWGIDGAIDNAPTQPPTGA